MVHAAHAVLEDGLLRGHLRVLLVAGRCQLLHRRTRQAAGATDLVSASDYIRLLADQLLASIAIW